MDAGLLGKYGPLDYFESAIVAITDVSTLFFGMTLNLSIMAVALPYFMGRVNRAARYAQAGIVLQTAGWISCCGQAL